MVTIVEVTVAGVASVPTPQVISRFPQHSRQEVVEEGEVQQVEAEAEAPCESP